MGPANAPGRDGSHCCGILRRRGESFAAGPGTKQIWLYSPTNLLVNENITKLEALWRRAAKAGYTHIYLTDTKFNSLQNMPKSYFKNVERVKRLAAELHLELVPGVFPIGWSNALLHHDPNLAEGLPVEERAVRREAWRGAAGGRPAGELAQRRFPI